MQNTQNMQDIKIYKNENMQQKGAIYVKYEE